MELILMLKKVEKKFIDIKNVSQNRRNGRIKNIGGKVDSRNTIEKRKI